MALDAGRCDMTPLVNNGIDNGVVPYVDLCPARNSANNQARVTRLHLKAVVGRPAREGLIDTILKWQQPVLLQGLHTSWPVLLPPPPRSS
jgi:hypothetical protein